MIVVIMAVVSMVVVLQFSFQACSLYRIYYAMETIRSNVRNKALHLVFTLQPTSRIQKFKEKQKYATLLASVFHQIPLINGNEV